jgi:hypothetical protein
MRSELGKACTRNTVRSGTLVLKRNTGTGRGRWRLSAFDEPSCSVATVLDTRPPLQQTTWPVGFHEVLRDSSMSASSAGTYSAVVLVLIPGGCFRGPAIWQQSLHPPPNPSVYSFTPPLSSRSHQTLRATWSFSTLFSVFSYNPSFRTLFYLSAFHNLQYFFGLF